MYVSSDTKIDQILSVDRKQSVECKSVEKFGLSLSIFELESFFFKFVTVCTYSVITYLEKVQLSNL